MRAVSAGAYDFQHLHARMRHRCGVLPHGRRAAGDLLNGLRLRGLGGQRRQKGRVLRRCGFTAHDLIHDAVGLLVAEIALADNFLYGFLNHPSASLFYAPASGLSAASISLLFSARIKVSPMRTPLI